MKKIKGTLCNLKSRDIKKHNRALVEIVQSPKFICQECARVAAKRRYLCDPVKLSKYKH